MQDDIKAKIGHYNETQKLLYTFWRQRNIAYLIFVAVASAAVVFTYGKENVPSILVQVLGAHYNMPADKIRSALPFRVMYCLISLCVIFSLTTLQHRAETVGRLVSYLRHLEIDVRKQLNLQTESTAFSFFRPNDNFFLSYLSFIYLMILLIPIGFLFANGIYGHWPSQAPEIWPIRSSTPSDIQMWVDRNFEFCVDMTSLLVVREPLNNPSIMAHWCH